MAWQDCYLLYVLHMKLTMTAYNSDYFRYKIRHVSLVHDYYFILGMYYIVGAVHRFYESRRRLFNDEQSGRVEAANKAKKNSKLTALRKQVCVARCNLKLHSV